MSKLGILYGFAAFHAAITLSLVIYHWREMVHHYDAPGGWLLALISVGKLSREGNGHRLRVFVYLAAALLSLGVIAVAYSVLEGRV